MDPVTSKAQLRETVRARRAVRDAGTALTPDRPHSVPRSPIAEVALQYVERLWPGGELGGRVIVAYAGLAGEPDLDPFIDAARARGARVFLPVVTRIGEALRFGEVTVPMATLAPQGRWGIREPVPQFDAADLLAEAAPDLILVPALGFGAGGARLGNGGGFYDRTFGPLGRAPLGGASDQVGGGASDQPRGEADNQVRGAGNGHADGPEHHGAPLVVGVCFAEEADLPGLAVEPWDLRIDSALTEDGLRTF